MKKIIFILFFTGCSKVFDKKINIEDIQIQQYQRPFLLNVILNGDFDKVKSIIQRYNTPAVINNRNIDKYGNNALHFAVMQKNTKILVLLIEKGGNIDFKNQYENTPLHLSILAENINAVKVLLENNADMEIKNKQGYTPFQMALKKKNNEIIKLFVEKKYGHELAQAKKGNKEPLQLAISQYSERRKVKIMKFLKYNKYI